MSRKAHDSRDSWLIYGLGALIVVAGFILAYQFVQPAPPRQIRIATGSAGNAYYQFGQRYAEQLATDQITLEVVETSGSLANLELLRQGKAELAFVQGGLADPERDTGLQALGSLYFEPLWIFVAKGVAVDRLSAFQGQRLAIGAQGSGTRAFAEQVLRANAITATNATLLEASGETALAALLSGEIDALFTVTGANSPWLRQLLTDGRIQPVSLARAKAYERRFDFLSALELPEGAIDLANNIPSQPVQLIAPAATLVTNSEFHPALTSLILQAASRTHAQRGLFETQGAFPSAAFIDLPLNSDAEQFYKRGTPFLQRYLPFWAANLIDRLFVMLLPLVTLLIPLMKILPPTYRWRIRSRIYRWYDQLRELDFLASSVDKRDECQQLMQQLEQIEQEVMQVTVPKSYADTLYNLRLHLRLIRERLERRLVQLPT